MNVKVKKLYMCAKLPTYAKQGDAGMDLYANENVIIRGIHEGGEVQKIKTGIAIEIPEGYVGIIKDKSGIASKYGLKILGGVIDSGYRGEVIVCMVNLKKQAYKISTGTKIAQIMIQKYENVDVVEVDELSKTERGDTGFGSSGK